jgi:hypothetical protein
MRQAWLTLVLACAAIALVTGVASADHVPGATYKGTHAQGEGSVWVVVSSDGRAVTRFYVDGVRGNICTMASDFHGATWPITGGPHSFSITVDETEWVYGTFRDPQTVEGTLRLGGHGSSCQSPTLTWSASVTNDPAPPGFGPRPPSPRCRVPRVVGLRLPVARALIKRSSCRVGTVRHTRSKRPRGKVISQKPQAGTLLPGGASVSLTVSRGW